MSDWIQMAQGVRRRTLAVGDRMHQVLVHFAAGATTPVHAHVHEQATAVLSGRMRFTIDGKERIVSAGESILLKSNQPHGAAAITETYLLDTFSPPREDMLKADADHAQNKF